MIFKHLKEDEIEELTLEIANTRSITPQMKEEVLLLNYINMGKMMLLLKQRKWIIVT